MNYEPPEQPSFSTHWRTRVSGAAPACGCGLAPGGTKRLIKIDVLRIGPRGDVYKELGGTP